MRIGIIGAGFAGRAAARLAAQHGHDVMLSNSRDPATLPATMLSCKVGTNADAASFATTVLLVLPFARHTTIAPALLAGKLVLHASDYNPRADGPIAALDSRATTASELLARYFVGARVVKALNTIPEKEIERDARPPGTPNRRALAYAGDDERAKALTAALYDEFGFDPVDAGGLDDAWRLDVDQPTFVVRMNADELRANLAKAERHLASE